MGGPALVELAAQVSLDEHIDGAAHPVGGPLGHQLLGQVGQVVRPAVDLPLVELARQKAVAIMKSFPESPEATELMKIYETIEKKAKAAMTPAVAEKAPN